MSRGVFRLVALALGLTVTSAAAHHPPLMERCVSVTFTGQVEGIEWHFPHVELFIRTDDGVGHRLTWLNTQQLSWVGIDRDTLRIGDQVVITATTRRDDTVDRPMLPTNIRRSRDDWEWSREAQGC